MRGKFQTGDTDWSGLHDVEEKRDSGKTGRGVM